jgi:hypothetical protein
MFARNVSINLRPNTLSEFLKTTENEIVPVTDAALPSTRELRFLHGRNTLPVEIEMVRKILRHEMI